ncbi:alpha/beta hydrolase [Amycolatopsis balhimycina DSM 5908]|uniref:Alpha/beta hydrolase n=1 Tax=Amycolatopsis balhimycina DSM 5908 TaxID=1081091 RepID=A0A428VWL6_AMYBA|nr:alpha/beta hydrolase [Amycolatopsis balhimycina]RSM35197.1 alpha/beta hydrolase [Amycolatopsis balhimycina DSM 5908]
MRRRRTRLLAALLALASAAGCAAGPSVRPALVENDGKTTGSTPSAAPGVPLPPLAEPQSPTLKWADCDDDTRQRIGTPGVPDSLHFTCARVTTPLDAPGEPRRSVMRLLALKVGSGPVPLVVVNDVDGDPGTVYAARLAATLPPAFLEKFSLIGLDRRGTGLSGAAQCVPADTRPRLIDADPAEGGLQDVLDAARKAGQQCAIELDDAQTALDSWRGAGDLDELRKQLGMDRLDAIGHGDGSKVLSEYAVRFPAQVGRMVFDGVPDPGADTAAVLDAVAAGAQSTWDAFAADCAARHCTLGDPKAALAALPAQLRHTLTTTGDGVRFGPGIAMFAVYSGLSQRSRWPELADAIAAAGTGNVSPLAAFAAPVLHDTRAQPSRLDAAIATRCNDSQTRLSADQLDQVAAGMRAKYPQFGTVIAQQLAWCGPWPVRTEPLPPSGAPGTPPILVTATAADPVTPQVGSTRAADQMPSAVTITWQGAGHGALGISPCVTEAARAFLLDGKIPADGTLCPA